MIKIIILKAKCKSSERNVYLTKNGKFFLVMLLKKTK